LNPKIYDNLDFETRRPVLHRSGDVQEDEFFHFFVVKAFEQETGMTRASSTSVTRT